MVLEVLFQDNKDNLDDVNDMAGVSTPRPLPSHITAGGGPTGRWLQVSLLSCVRLGPTGQPPDAGHRLVLECFKRDKV